MRQKDYSLRDEERNIHDHDHTWNYWIEYSVQKFK